MNNELLKMEPLLKILKSITTIFEGSNQSLSTVFPIIERAIDCLEELSDDEEFRDIYHEIIKCLLQYTINSSDGGIWILAYILTPDGIDEIRSLSNGGKRKRGNIKDFYIEKKKQSDDDIEDSFSIETIKQFYIEDSSNCDVEDIDQSEDARKYIKRSALEIEKIGKILGYNQPQIQNILSYFDAYVEGNFDEEKMPFRRNPFKNSWNWFTIKEEPGISAFADIALRLAPTPCSEASAERTISLQRMVLLKNRNRSNKDLIDARIVLMRL